MKVLSFEASLVKYIKFFKVSLSGFRATCLFGDYLLSHDVSIVVPSALRGLTSVFGMGTGVSLLLLSPYLFTFTSQSITVYISSQVFDLLVSVSFDITIFTPLTYLSCFLQVIS